MFTPAARVFLKALPFFLIPACDDGPTEAAETVTLSGEVVLNDYEYGTFVIMACESQSSSFVDAETVTVTHPGECVAETTLLAPGAFALKAKITWADVPPEIDLMVYLLADPDDSLSSCIAGGAVSLPLQPHSGLSLTLKTGQCPMRK